MQGAGAELGEILISQRTSDGRRSRSSRSRTIPGCTPTIPPTATPRTSSPFTLRQDTVHFILNDKLVRAIAKSQLNGLSTNGQAGIRINHNIDVDVDWKGVTK